MDNTWGYLLAMIDNLSQFAASCTPGSGGNILSIPPWYKYLDCDVAGNVQNFELGQVWLIVAAVLEMILRIGVVVAVVFVIIGGFMLMTSSGDPNRVASGRTTIINAVIGLVIAVLATSLVSFLAGSFDQSASSETGVFAVTVEDQS